MKDATYFAEIACREMTQDEQVRFRPLIYNLFVQAQAEAFMHAGLMADEQMLQESVGKQLRQHAQVIWPGYQEIKRPADSTEEAKTETLLDPVDLPPAA